MQSQAPMDKSRLISAVEQPEGNAAKMDKNDYGTTSQQADAREDERIAFPSCRLILYLMMFLGFVVAYSLRGCLSETIVAMVNSTATDADEAATNFSVSVEGQCPRDDETLSHAGGGQFNWDRQLQGFVLSAFYYGYISSQLGAGWLADRFGGRWLFGGGLLGMALLTLLTPVIAGVSAKALIILRVIEGVSEGFMLPSTNALLARWTPTPETTRAVTFVFSGHELGYFVGMLAGGLLSDYGFAGGWPSVFYVLGLAGCVWALAWFLLCYSSPAEHPRISAAERAKLDAVAAASQSATRPPTPWRKILTSLPVWVLIAAKLAHTWTYYTLVSGIPLFFSDVLGFSMTQNGVWASLAYLVSWSTTIFAGLLSDWLRASGRLSTTLVRKIFCAVGLLVPGLILVLSGVIGCNRAAVVAMVIIANGFSAMMWSVVVSNPIDIAPTHAATLLGFAATFGVVSSIITPLIIGALTYHHTRAQWQNVFYIVLALECAATLVYLLFATGERQEWDSKQSDAKESEPATEPIQPMSSQ